MGAKRKLTFETLDSGCIICTSHSPNLDGYLRLLDRRGYKEGRPRMTMYHRFVWETSNGDIPEGFEVDHTCRNRACQNVEHMQLLTVSEHKGKTNKERCDDKRAKAFTYWQATGCSNKVLEEIFEVTPGTGARWHRYWKGRDEQFI